MGRSSAAKSAQRAKDLTAAREEALGAMNAALRKKVADIESLGEETRANNLRYYRLVGAHVLDVRENQDDKYGEGAEKRPMQLLEMALFIAKRTLRKAATFAAAYTVPEVEELIAMRNEAANFAIHWGHLTYLLTLSTTAQRLNFAQRTVRNLWDPPALYSAIRRSRGKTGVDPRGRTHILPKTVHLQIRQIMESTRAWVTKYTSVWNGDDHNVIANILSAPPDDLDQVDLENLDTILELLPQLRTNGQQLAALVRDAKQHVTEVLAARTRQIQADEVRETQDAASEEVLQGREPRAIDLSGDEPTPAGSTTQQRRRRQAMATV